MLANMLPWAAVPPDLRRSRSSTRELVQRRIGRLAGLIVGCDALVAWCSWLLDQGYRGEMECIIAKIFGSEAQKEAAIELFMKTHGGRAFLHGHLFGDNVHEYLAPCIYEGEGEMLGMALLQVADQGARQDVLRADRQGACGRGNPAAEPAQPRAPVCAKGVAMPYVKWVAGKRLTPLARPNLPKMPKSLHEHAEFACRAAPARALEISDAMSKHQLKLADRQCRMAELSQRCQDVITILTTSLYGARSNRSACARRGRFAVREHAPEIAGAAAIELLLPPGDRTRGSDRRRAV